MVKNFRYLLLTFYPYKMLFCHNVYVRILKPIPNFCLSTYFLQLALKLDSVLDVFYIWEKTPRREQASVPSNQVGLYHNLEEFIGTVAFVA